MTTTIISHQARHYLLLSFLPVLSALVLLFVLSSPNAASSAPSTPGKTLASPLDPANCWAIVASPSTTTDHLQLYDVTAISANDAWAVGTSDNGQSGTTLIEHWDGAAWTVVPSPSPGLYHNDLESVDALSSNDIWAVGATYGNSHFSTHPLALHWNGTQWSVIAVPTNLSEASLRSVKVFAANDAWAVGTALFTFPPMMWHWDGTNWSMVSAPPASLFGIDGAAPNDIWAVGNGITLHWTGSNWTEVSATPPSNICDTANGFTLDFKDVSARATNDVWAVGNCYNSPLSYALAAHWDGTHWTMFTMPGNGTLSLHLSSVEAVAANDVWASGHVSSGDRDAAFMVHWDGTQWTPVTVPDPQISSNYLCSITATSAADVWTVGYSITTTQPTTIQPLIEHYVPCAPPCPGEQFTDVCPGDYFYEHILALNADNIVSGYNTSPPCDNSLWIPCFKPANTSTRGQIAKVVSLAANFTEPVSGQSFEDVPPTHTFYQYIERMASRNIITGYPCGGAGEPCGTGNLPYFRSGNNVTRGQLAKITALSFIWSDPISIQQFADVPVNSTFYTYIAQLYTRGIISGYPCGSPSEPCGPGNLPYFRPGNNVTRGQIAKIVDLARTQPTSTPTPTATPAISPTTTPATATATPTNPDCQGIPPSSYMQITPGNCQPAGTRFGFVGSGFQPGEMVGVSLTAPDGSVFGAPSQLQVDPAGYTEPLGFSTSTGMPLGQWVLTMQGETSQHQAIGYFRLLAP